MAPHDFKRRFIAAIERTGDPRAPIILNDAFGAIDALGRLMAYGNGPEKADAFAKTMLQGFPKDMDHIASDPNFIVALSSMLSNALVAYGVNLLHKHDA